MLKRAAEGELDWVIADFPTNALAQEAKMSLDEYTQFVIKSCYLYLDDPAAKWAEINQKQEAMANYLTSTSTLRVVGENTDITFSTQGRLWKNCSGECNFPDGEVVTFDSSATENTKTIYRTYYNKDLNKDILFVDSALLK